MPQIKRKEYKDSSLKHNGLKSGALFSPLWNGSLTVETALVLPLFLFTMVTVLFLFRVLQLQYMVGDALDKAVAEAALQKQESPQEVENKIKLLFYQELEIQGCPVSMINQQLAGVLWDLSDVDDKYIDMKVTYQIKMPGWILKNKVVSVTECIRCRRWTGMSGAGNEDTLGEWVYITPEGSVYHKNRECTHLKLTVQSVSAEAAAGYRACERCAKKKKITPFVYITEEGDCYHLMLNCSGLKRTVFLVPLWQTQGRVPCSRCGGK